MRGLLSTRIRAFNQSDVEFLRMCRRTRTTTRRRTTSLRGRRVRSLGQRARARNPPRSCLDCDGRAARAHFQSANRERIPDDGASAQTRRIDAGGESSVGSSTRGLLGLPPPDAVQVDVVRALQGRPVLLGGVPARPLEGAQGRLQDPPQERPRYLVHFWGSYELERTQQRLMSQNPNQHPRLVLLRHRLARRSTPVTTPGLVSFSSVFLQAPGR